MMPAYEGLGSDNDAIIERHNRLVVQAQFATFDGRRQRCGEGATRSLVVVAVAVEYRPAPATVVPRPGAAGDGGMHDLGRIRSGSRTLDHTDAGRDRHFVAVDACWF